MRGTCSSPRTALLVALAASALVASTKGFSLPGVQMVTYRKGETLPIFVNSLTSTETLLPLDYYALPFCQVRLVAFLLRMNGLARVRGGYFIEGSVCVLLTETEVNVDVAGQD